MNKNTKTNCNKGFTSTDIIISIIAIMLFASLIVSLILNNALKNVKLYKEAEATLYLTETFEQIGMANYTTASEYSNQYDVCIPEEAASRGYIITINKPESLGEKDIIQKITADIEYSIGDKTYKQTMIRTKIKE